MFQSNHRQATEGEAHEVRGRRKRKRENYGKMNKRPKEKGEKERVNQKRQRELSK